MLVSSKVLSTYYHFHKSFLS